MKEIHMMTKRSLLMKRRMTLILVQPYASLKGIVGERWSKPYEEVLQ